MIEDTSRQMKKEQSNSSKKSQSGQHFQKAPKTGSNLIEKPRVYIYRVYVYSIYI